MNKKLFLLISLILLINNITALSINQELPPPPNNTLIINGDGYTLPPFTIYKTYLEKNKDYLGVRL